MIYTPCWVDPEMFFPHETDYAAIDEAKVACQPCPERDTCLAGALERHEQFGVWGGKSTAEREAILRRQRRARFAA